MRLKFKSLTGLLVLAAVGFASAAIAEPTSTFSRGNETVADKFDRALFENEPDFYRNRSIGSKLNLIFGLGSFPDRRTHRDARLVDRLYKDSLDQQAASDLTIRTPDLPNPYDTSVFQFPASNAR